MNQGPQYIEGPTGLLKMILLPSQKGPANIPVQSSHIPSILSSYFSLKKTAVLGEGFGGGAFKLLWGQLEVGNIKLERRHDLEKVRPSQTNKIPGFRV